MQLTKLEKRLLCMYFQGKCGRSRKVNFLKYLPLILKFKNVAEVYKEETGQGKPFYMSRRFIGLVITVIFAVTTIWTGVTVDDALSLPIVDSIVAIVTAVITLYGIVLGIIGQVKKVKL